MKDQIGPITNEHRKLVINDSEKEDILFNIFFSSVFTDEKGMFDRLNINGVSPKVLLWLTEIQVKMRVVKHNVNKSPGPDGLHPQVLRKLSSNIKTPY